MPIAVELEDEAVQFLPSANAETAEATAVVPNAIAEEAVASE
jgi:hypothetical protein